MKNLIAATLVTLLATAGFYQANKQSESDFEQWAARHQKFYNQDERIYRESIYNQNKQMIDEHNSRPDVTYTLSENQFMTLTNEEFVSLFLNTESIESVTEVFNQQIETDQILQAVDWRNYTSVKTQGQCASGWAFSVSNSVEAWYLIRGSRNLSVSTQQIVDCDTYSSGCTGGTNVNAMYYVYTRGLVNSTSYPYVAKTQTCQQRTNGTWFINSYLNVSGSQYNLQSYLQNYPVSVGVDATNWQFYKSGLFSNCTSNVTNHYALAVGFDTSNNWIVQNSFGPSWGESGHIRLYSNNTCGILNQAYQIY